MNDGNLVNRVDFYKKKPLRNSIELKKDEIEKFFDSFRAKATKSRNLFTKFADLSSICPDICFRTTGFTKDELIFILSHLKSWKNSPNRKKNRH